MKKDIAILNISDIHLGHLRTTTEEIIDNLRKFFHKHHRVISKTDILVISGDMYDRILSLGSKEANMSLAFLIWLAKLCVKNDIKLRILEGTPSHDWGQISTFKEIVSTTFKDLDFVYHNVLTIETIMEWDFKILFVPDEWTDASKTTMDDIERLMIDNKLDKVDLVVSHGEFEYHLPIESRDSTHCSEQFLNLTDNYILNGHIHKNSVYDRILTPGSFDRLSHGEEEKKGGFLVYINRSTPNNFIFLENTLAKTYLTIKVSTLDIQVVLRQIQKLSRTLLHGSAIKIKLSGDSPIAKELNTFKLKFPQYKFKIETNTVKRELQREKQTYTSIHIMPNNIKSLLLESIGEELEGDELMVFDSIMEEVR